MALVAVEKLTFTYPEGTAPALKNISLNIEPGEFLVLCGTSGCGKSTLLNHMKTVLTPFGKREGRVLYRGSPLEQMGQREQTEKIGYVLQDPENQAVTDKVWHELAYGLENLGYDPAAIRLRVAEMASYFGIQEWYHRDVAQLSGGQKQLLNLAAVMAMQPELLILDEPTSQLDPIAAADFLATIKKINNEIGTTIVLSEHRLEEAFPLADRAVVMGDGAITAAGPPEEVGYILRSRKDPMLAAMPAPMRIYLSLEEGDGSHCPVTVRQGKEYLQKYAEPEEKEPAEETAAQSRAGAEAGERIKKEPALLMKNVWFRYERSGQDVVRDLSLKVQKGELYCIVGGNGTGKSTALGLMAGIRRPSRGKIRICGTEASKAMRTRPAGSRIGLLPQDPQCLFLKKTIREDLMDMISEEVSEEERKRLAKEAARLTGTEGLLDRHPYDVSGGERQRAALAKVLLSDPDILLLDEPTKGMDSFFKKTFAGILKGLLQRGVTIVAVSHDIEFCALYADRCALFFDGGIIAENTPRKFFAGNSFYTTAVNRMCRHVLKSMMTVEDVERQCGKKNGKKRTGPEKGEQEGF